MHSTPAGWRLGLPLSLCTALLWGVLPIVLKQMLASLDAFTLTGYRFVFAAVALGLWLGLRCRLPNPAMLRGRSLLLLGAASVGLVGNYVCYLLSVRRITPSGAQVLIQLAPLLLLCGSVFLLKETMSRLQWIGCGALVVGLGLFFNLRLPQLTQGTDFLTGVLWMLLASLTWAAYAIAQKLLLRGFTSPAILLAIYFAAAAMLLPVSDLSAWRHLDGRTLWLLLFCCANTVLAYGAFAEALAHWQASRVSATLAITPLVTVLSSHLLNRAWPGAVAIEPANALAYLGAVLVAGGSALTALGR